MHSHSPAFIFFPSLRGNYIYFVTINWHTLFVLLFILPWPQLKYKTQLILITQVCLPVQTYKKHWNELPAQFQLRPTLCYTMDYRPPGSSVHRILQARIILEWVAISSSKESSQLKGRICVSSFGTEPPGTPKSHYTCNYIYIYAQQFFLFIFHHNLLLKSHFSLSY